MERGRGRAALSMPSRPDASTRPRAALPPGPPTLSTCPNREDRRLLTGLVVWEYPGSPQQGSDLLALLAAIRIHLPEDRYLLTAALPAAKGVLENLDLRRCAEYLDSVNLMAYDFFGPWTPRLRRHLGTCGPVHSH